MKKLLLLFAIIAFGFTAKAQSSFTIGANSGIPLGDANESSSVGFEIELARLSNISENIKVGLGTSFQYFIGKESTVNGVKVEAKNSYSLPVYGSARLDVWFLTLGFDAGYSFGLSNADGGIYGKALVGVRFGNLMVQAVASGTEKRIMSGAGLVITL